MTTVITWYDVLGVLPDATPDDIREAWQARKAALEAGRLAGASPEVLAAADRARQAVQGAWRVLADPAARESYDEEAGFVRPGEGLAPPGRGPLGPDVGLGEGWSTADEEALEPYPGRASPVVVPDVRGLFYRACTDVVGRVGLHIASIRLTPRPMPVEGLVVGQAPAPGERVRHDSTLTVRLWHPPEPGGQPVASG
jgi:PASTA domain-containing protein